LALAGLILALMAGSVMAQKTRKLPAKAYISSAKIAIVDSERNPELIDVAQAMLDSLFMHHGPHSEGYYWYSQIQWDKSNATADLKEKLPFVQKAILYADSLKWSCDNKDIKKNYRKKCGDLDEEMDSILVDQWRHFYNEGVEQISEVEELMETLKVETDSASKAYYQTRQDALVDSCQDRMTLAITIDSTDAKPFIGLASVNEKIGDFETAIKYLKLAVPKSDDTCSMKVEVAYDFIRMDDYCGAIPWFQEYVDCMSVREEVMQDPGSREGIIGTAHNLASCYNNCKQYESAYATFGQILTWEPADVKALQGAGRYQQHKGRQASDSATNYRETDEAMSRTWQETRDMRFDSSIVFLAQAFELSSDDAELAAEYSLMLAIRQRFEEAQVGFARASELKPEEADYWISLGDCNLQLHLWEAAAEAYERVVELQPDKKSVWERLSDLYQQIGNKETRRNEILEKLKTM
jgi:tetratricopeptide (TPR) repeat protein